MKSLPLLTSILASTAASAAVTGLSDTEDEPISYDGFKVFRLPTHGHPATVEEKLKSITFEQWNHDVDRHLDVVVAPDQLDAFEALGLDFHVMHEDLGSSIAAETASGTVYRRQVDDPSWYDAYHNYEDHIQYFHDLQAAFPNNSELISSGRSYQDRDLFGLHLWGAEGPGKPAVLYHGTVHAREWISTKVPMQSMRRR